MKVPRGIAASHIALINSSLIIAKSFSGIQKLSTDPLQALISTKKYSEEIVLFGKYLNEILAYLSQAMNEAQKI